ncbi:hypothetical protein ACQPZG_31775 [Streptomyces sp. CA-294286]|uniref:hypothetical protein n=1 Tax=Streptomyces sp. CA-294286 TaxID=3240070 RepID=UPI003D94E45B
MANSTPAPDAPAITSLIDFSAQLASRLPGAWSVQYHPHAPDSYPLDNAVWDCGNIHWLTGNFDLGGHVELNGPGEQCLAVFAHPYAAKFAVSPIVPAVTHHHLRYAEAPNGITTATDPARAAATVARRVLPRYQGALAAIRHGAQLHPERPLPPEPPRVSDAVTFTAQPDGWIGTRSDTLSPEVRDVLYTYGFVDSVRKRELVTLVAVDANGRSGADRVQAAAHALGAIGIGVNLRYSAAPARPLPPSRAHLTQGRP